MRFPIIICFAGIAVFPMPLLAQVRAPGDIDPTGRVLAKVSAAMTEPGALPRPVSGLTVVAIADNGDRIEIQTDDAGIANFWLRPGGYRFLTSNPVAWEGKAYSWDIVTAVQPGIPAIRLSQDNATNVAAIAAPPQTLPAPAAAAGAPQQGAAGSAALRLFVDCRIPGCDFDYFRTEIPFVDYVRDRADASVHILVTGEQTASGGTAYTLYFIGLREFSGKGDTLRHVAPQNSSNDERRSGLARTMKLGILRFVAATPVAERLRITYTVPATTAESPGPTAVTDPWNLWVFRVNANGYFSGETSQRFESIRGSASANRTSEEWKSRLGVNGTYNEARYTLSDGSKFASYAHSWGASQLLVKSLGPHWSAGERMLASGSTFYNQRLSLRFAPAIEYNIFPYSESTRRQLTLQFALGINSFHYDDTTIFNKVSEVRPDNSITLSLDIKQPWGSVSSAVEGAAFLDDFTKRRLVLYNSLDVRLFRGFNVNMFVGASFLRDQIYLAKGKLSDEDILIQRRQLASSYTYYGGIGLSYTFGSIFNNVVNPRFEGGHGGTYFF